MNDRRQFMYAIVTTIWLLLISCGGGGDSGGANTGSPPVITNQPASVTVYESQSAIFSVGVTSTSAVAYQWQKGGQAIAGANTAQYTLANVSKNDTGSLFNVLVSNKDGSTLSSSATLVVLSAAPAVTDPPKTTIAASGESATFAVTAQGLGPFSYQWYRGNEPIQGATGSSYTTNIKPEDNGVQYSVQITNNAGTVRVQVATVALEGAPTITTQPVATTVYESQPASLSVTASALRSVSYQWKKNGVAILGATAATYSIAAASKSDDDTYTVVVTGAGGSVTSSPTRLTVKSATPSIVNPPQATAVVAGQTATFQVTVDGLAPFSYQWKRNGIAISGANSASYTTPFTTANDDGALYHVTVSNPFASGKGLAGVDSTPALLTVWTPPVITNQPASTTVYETQSATFSVSVNALAGHAMYQWRKTLFGQSTANGAGVVTYQWSKNGTAISGANAASYTMAPTTMTDNNASLRVRVSGPGGTVDSTSATLTVKSAALSIVSAPASTTVAAGQTARFSVTADGLPPYSYQWTRNGQAIAGANGASYTTPPTQGQDHNARYAVQISNPVGTITSSDAVLSVVLPPTITQMPTSLTVYETQAAVFTVSATSSAPLTYQWRNNGVDIPGATANTYTINPVTIGLDGTRISVVVTGFGLSTVSDIALLTVNPAALSVVAAPQAASIQIGQTATFSVSVSGLPPYQYQWLRNGVSISGATAQSYTTALATLSDSGTLYSVRITNPKGSLTTDAVPLNVRLATVSDLTISEISVCHYPNIDCWFEVYNAGSAAVNLADYIAKVTSRDSVSGASGFSASYSLPNISVPAGGYVVLSGNYEGRPQLGQQLVRLNANNSTPYWFGVGAIELLKNNATVDFVMIGNSGQGPTTAGGWTGAGIASTLVGASNYGKSVVRPFPIQTKSNSAADWVAVDWATPAGQNDVPPGTPDNDGDGIPDSAEVPGGTYAGLDLYAMGVRAGVRDILVEVDNMISLDAGIVPRIEALRKVQAAFAAKGINLLFDAGSRFSTTFSPSSFNLGQATYAVPYEPCVTMQQVTCTLNTSARRSIHDWKAEFMDLRRRNIFHYMLFGSTQNANGVATVSGVAELIGNDLIITLGGNGLHTESPTGTNLVINFQAATVMHELGHNLGLQHGGFEGENYKPNYLSVMNYLYSFYGLPPNAKTATAYQRWLLENARLPGGLCALEASPCNDPAQYNIGYSDGLGKDLNETALLESDNIGYGSESANDFADWNQNQVKDSATLSMDINPFDLTVEKRSTLKDYNDWNNLVLPFARYAAGNSGKSPLKRTAPVLDAMANDRQPEAPENPPPAVFFKQLRQALAH